MTTKLWTTSTCDRCGKFVNREGSMPGSFPDHWARMTIEYNSLGIWEKPAKELCQSCYFQFDDWMRQPEKKNAG